MREKFTSLKEVYVWLDGENCVGMGSVMDSFRNAEKLVLEYSMFIDCLMNLRWFFSKTIPETSK